MIHKFLCKFQNQFCVSVKYRSLRSHINNGWKSLVLTIFPHNCRLKLVWLLIPNVSLDMSSFYQHIWMKNWSPSRHLRMSLPQFLWARNACLSLKWLAVCMSVIQSFLVLVLVSCLNRLYYRDFSVSVSGQSVTLGELAGTHTQRGIRHSLHLSLHHKSHSRQIFS